MEMAWEAWVRSNCSANAEPNKSVRSTEMQSAADSLPLPSANDTSETTPGCHGAGALEYHAT